MASSHPSYAILLTKVQRADNLRAVGLHNGRLIPVPGADPSVKNGCKVLRLDGTNAYNAVAARIEKSGAKWPGLGRIYAFEAVATFSPGADPMPSIEVLAKRGMDFCDRLWGRENVVAGWGHIDEKTPHAHFLVVPICLGLSPGRRHDDEDEPKPKLVVSWNKFSGSDERDYRDPKKELKSGKKRRKETAKAKSRENKVMCGWQSAWAAEWSDYGLMRGIKSKRGHLSMKWVRGHLESIAGLADTTLAGIIASIEALEPSGLDMLKLRRNPSPATLSELFKKYVLPEIEACLEPLKLEAAKGIQLENERTARADLWKEHVELKAKFDALHSATSGGHPSYKELKAENGALKQQMDELKAASANPNPEALLEHLGRLSDAEFALLIETSREERREVSRRAKRPKISEPGKGFQEPSGPSQ